jgi:hypothetical protein
MKRQLTWKTIFLSIVGATYLVTVSLLAASGASDSHRQLLYVATAREDAIPLDNVGPQELRSAHREFCLIRALWPSISARQC